MTDIKTALHHIWITNSSFKFTNGMSVHSEKTGDSTSVMVVCYDDRHSLEEAERVAADIRNYRETKYSPPLHVELWRRE